MRRPDEESASGADVHLTVVIPAYNEATRIRPTLRRIQHYLSGQSRPFEIVVYLDGCDDATAEVVADELAVSPSARVLVGSTNRGKGHAVRSAMLKARGRFVLFTDADLSTPIEEVERLLGALNSGAHVAIGSRALADSRIRVPQSYWRRALGRSFNYLVRWLLIPGIQDTQCGFKCFRAGVARRVFSRQRIDGFGFDVEVLWIAIRLGYRVAEVPITWNNSPLSTVHPIRDAFGMFLSVLAIRWNDWRGRYEDARQQE
ncbi:MAG: glycosyltransferase family 2 protein [Gammaproteobacteria bacterium]|nr:glycosyltransferase family 2 protein [Gammaproteobacteria bacterium]